MSPPRFERLLPIIAVAVFTASVGLVCLGSASNGTLGYDFRSYALAVHRFLDGRPLYDPTTTAFGPFGGFFYPPTFALLILPFGLLDPAAGVVVFTAIGVLAFALSVAVMPIPTPLRWVMVLLGGLSWPLVFAIKLGQVGPLLLLFFAIGWRAIERRGANDRAAVAFGAAAALGAAIKVQPAIVLGWALLAGRFRALLAGVVALLALALAATIVFGPESWGAYLDLLAQVSRPLDTPHQFSPARLAVEAGLSVDVANAVLYANLVGVAAAVLLAIRSATPVASYLATVVASQLVSPVLWDHYAMMLLLPVAWLLSRGRWWAAVIVLATPVPLVAIIPGVVYPIAFWVTLLAVVVEGVRERDAERRAVAAAGA
jgi:hypothetical protein